MIDKTLPRIISLDGVTSAAEFGDVTCPHCGAKGRHIYYFTLEDGRRHGAMAGCIQKFPQHEFVAIHLALLQKQEQYKKDGWKLATWDVKILDAINGFVNGTIEESLARRIIACAKKDKADYARRKYGRR